MRREQGFTLLEVLMAVLVVGLVYGFLLQFVSATLVSLGDARNEIELARLAELKLREIETKLLAGEERSTSVVEEGEFESPNEGYRFRVTADPFMIPLPESYLGEGMPASIFAPREAGQDAPPGLMLIEARVFSELEEPESARPFVLIVPVISATTNPLAN